MIAAEKKDKLLLIFTKNPVAGKVKTRLAKDIGDSKALDIYKFLLSHSESVTKTVAAKKQVYYSNSIADNDIWDSEIFEKKLQHGSDLGERMKNAFENGFEDGYRKIIIIGTDLYDINSEDIEFAFQELENHDFVIGPAADGGYYLLGMKSLNSKIFKNKKWGTSSVLENTLRDLEKNKVKQLEIRNDVDLLDDIKDHPAFQKFNI